jgi:hypothetical protein
MAPPLASPAYRHFDIVPLPDKNGNIGDRRACRHDNCSANYSMNTSTSTLQLHCDTAHRGENPPPRLHSPNTSSSSSSSSSSPTAPHAKRRKTHQSTLYDTHVQLNNSALRPALAALFAACSWPAMAVQLPEFIHFVNVCRTSDCALPGRRLVPKDQALLATQLRGSSGENIQRTRVGAQ